MGLHPKRPDVESLEALLHYFQVTCGPAVAGMGPEQRSLFQANIYCVAAEALVSCHKKSDARVALLQATQTYYEELAQHVAQTKKGDVCPTPEASWIDFAAVAAKAKGPAQQKPPAPDARLLPKVIVFDESTGVPQTEQDAREAEVKHDPVRADIPWQEWLGSAVAESLGGDAAAVAAITLVLGSLHRSGKVHEQLVTMTMDLGSKHRTAQARGKLEPMGLELPPCAPVAGRIVDNSSHPQRVPIIVTTKVRAERPSGRKKLATKGPEQADDELLTETRTFYIHPEYKLPEDTTPEDAVASGADARTRTWAWKGDESLHPFWGIPRMSADDLKKHNAASGKHLAFNVALQEKEYNVVTVGDVRGHSVATTWCVRVPMLTNPETVAPGEELLLEVAPKPAVAAKRKAACWKDDVAVAARAKAKAKAHAPSAPERPADEDEV